MPNQQNIFDIFSGSYREQRISLSDAAGNPLDLRAYTVTFYLGKDGQVVLSKSSTDNPPTIILEDQAQSLGQCRVIFNSSDTTGASGNYTYEVWLMDGNGKSYLILYGNASIKSTMRA